MFHPGALKPVWVLRIEIYGEDFGFRVWGRASTGAVLAYHPEGSSNFMDASLRSY